MTKMEMDEYKQDTEKALLDVLSTEEIQELVEDGSKGPKPVKPLPVTTTEEYTSAENLPPGLVSPSLKLQHQLEGTWGDFKKEAISELKDALISDKDQQLLLQQKEIESLREERDAAIAELGTTLSQVSLLEAALEDAVIHAEEQRSKSVIAQLSAELDAERKKNEGLQTKLNTRDGEVRELIEVLSEDQKKAVESSHKPPEVSPTPVHFEPAPPASSPIIFFQVPGIGDAAGSKRSEWIEESESVASMDSVRTDPAQQGESDPHLAGVQRRAFSLARTAQSIRSAIKDAFKLDEDQRTQKIEALKTRWDPDKNPILTELSAEVTKIINRTVETMQTEGQANGDAKKA